MAMPDPVTTAAAKEIAQVLNNAFDSPSKEIGNYIADKIRYLRYTSLLKIVQRAEAQALATGMTLKMPPLKFFVPFSEGASLEEPRPEELTADRGSVLQELWAKLLIESSRSYDSRHAVFIRILKEISANEVAFLRRLVEEHRARVHWRGSTWSYEDAGIVDTRHFAHFAQNVSFLKDESIGKLIIECFEGSGMMFYDVSTGQGKPYGPAEDTSYQIVPNYNTDERRAAHSVLVSLGIIKEFYADYLYYDNDRYFDISGVHLTDLGIDFIKTCSDFSDGQPCSDELEIDSVKKEVRVVEK